MDAEWSTVKRQDALKWLPRIEAPPEPNYSINDAARMVGKTIATSSRSSPKRLRWPASQTSVLCSVSKAARSSKRGMAPSRRQCSRSRQRRCF